MTTPLWIRSTGRMHCATGISLLLFLCSSISNGQSARISSPQNRLTTENYSSYGERSRGVTLAENERGRAIFNSLGGVVAATSFYANEGSFQFTGKSSTFARGQAGTSATAQYVAFGPCRILADASTSQTELNLSVNLRVSGNLYANPPSGYVQGSGLPPGTTGQAWVGLYYSSYISLGPDPDLRRIHRLIGIRQAFISGWMGEYRGEGARSISGSVNYPSDDPKGGSIWTEGPGLGMGASFSDLLATEFTVPIDRPFWIVTKVASCGTQASTSSCSPHLTCDATARARLSVTLEGHAPGPPSEDSNNNQGVFNIPMGFKVEGLQGMLVDNQWMGSPIPDSLPLLDPSGQAVPLNFRLEENQISVGWPSGLSGARLWYSDNLWDWRDAGIDAGAMNSHFHSLVDSPQRFFRIAYQPAGAP